MKMGKPILLAMFIALGGLVTNSIWSKEDQDGFSHQPIAKAGKKWRIAYYQGGPPNNY